MRYSCEEVMKVAHLSQRELWAGRDKVGCGEVGHEQVGGRLAGRSPTVVERCVLAYRASMRTGRACRSLFRTFDLAAFARNTAIAAFCVMRSWWDEISLVSFDHR